MITLASLWLPIVLSAVLVFVLSSVIHMMLGYHANDVVAVPDEEAARKAIGPLKLPPGDYSIPRASSMAAMKSPEYAEKLNQGPVTFLTVLPNGPISMGKSLAQWFLYSLLVSFVAAYVASRALEPGAHYLSVFRFVGVTAFASYSLALLQNSIWWSRNWGATLK
ncbi:MAG: hypothetical protein OEY20_10960, partial [Gemmatimonadota bacterium]|nr:hypothetical protein [Gemmatimonadota bacterium]